VQLGLMAPESSVPLAAAILREVTVRSSYGSTPASWQRALALLSTGGIRLDPLITSVLPLDAWRLAVSHFDNQDGIKTVIDPRLP
jgi:L-iditol 2-dehydrogenase